MQSPQIHKSLMTCIYTVRIFLKGYTEFILDKTFFHFCYIIIKRSSISGSPVFYKYSTSITIKLFCKSKWFFKNDRFKRNDSKVIFVFHMLNLDTRGLRSIILFHFHKLLSRMCYSKCASDGETFKMVEE